MELILVLHNIRSTYNVGAILRTAEGLGVREVILSGYTPRFNDERLLPHLREKLNHQIAKTALGAEEMLTIKTCDDLPTKIHALKSKGVLIAGLENNLEDARKVSLKDFQTKNSSLALILGEEVNGIPAEILAECEVILEIPMVGRKESFNVSIAAAIALWELTRKSL
ncbi:MAG: TrmH family RNA methyltransferase [Candidatus Saccharibacteria bacterium]|nr:TrmH family RNA methyltransferase [Candidatus Saccharibacteria bacterium]